MVNAEAIEQAKEDACTQYGNEWFSNQVHVQEQNCKQFQRCCANMTEEQQTNFPYFCCCAKPHRPHSKAMPNHQLNGNATIS